MGVAFQRLYYGHVLVWAGFAVLLSMYGTLYSFGILLKPILQDLGMSRASTSGAYSLCFFLSGALSMAAGWLNDRIGPRAVLSCSGILIGAGYLLLSRIANSTELYIYYGLLVGIGMSGGIAPVLSTIARWFAAKRGLMTGFAVAGVGTGTLMVPPLADRLIAAFGWRTALFLLGATLLLMIVGLAQLFERDPMTRGLRPYGADSHLNGPNIGSPDGISFRDACRDPRLWMIFAVYVLSGFVIQVALVHIAIYAMSLGASGRSAAVLLSFIGGGSLLGRIFGGAASDRLGSKPMMVTSTATMVVLFLLLVLSHNTLTLVLFAALFGLAYGEILCMMPILPAELFGLRNHGAILGMITFSSTLGGGLGPLVAGVIFDVSGGYEIVWITCVGVSVAAVLASASIRRSAHPANRPIR